MKLIFKRGLLLMAFVFGVFFRLSAQSQLIVTLNDGSEQSFYMTENDRLYFEENTRLVIEIVENKRLVKIDLADIRKMNCYELTNTAETPNQGPNLYPNPVHNVMTILHLQGTQTIKIFAIDGRLMKTFEATENQIIDISELPIGLYLVKTPTSTHKMIKL